jgi:hypothetical protein
VEVPDLHDIGPEGAAYGDPLAAHPLGHDDEHPVSLDGCYHRERVARVAARGLDDGVAVVEQALVLGAFDHVLRDTRLYGARRVQVLHLAVDAIYLDQGCPPDGVEDAVG